MIKSPLSPPSRQVATSPPSSAPPPIAAPTHGGTNVDPMAPRLTGARVAMAKSVFATGRFEILVLGGLVMCCPSMVHLTLALSGRPQRIQARGRRKLDDAPDARRSTSLHRPLERVVRCPYATHLSAPWIQTSLQAK